MLDVFLVLVLEKCLLILKGQVLYTLVVTTSFSHLFEFFYCAHI